MRATHCCKCQTPIVQGSRGYRIRCFPCQQEFHRKLRADWYVAHRKNNPEWAEINRRRAREWYAANRGKIVKPRDPLLAALLASQ
jgi:uncharacterized Zn finger protein (UPF0148 family)